MDDALRRAERDAAGNDAYLAPLERLVHHGAQSHAYELRRDQARRDLLGCLQARQLRQTSVPQAGEALRVRVVRLMMVVGEEHEAYVDPLRYYLHEGRLYLPGLAPWHGDRLVIHGHGRAGRSWVWIHEAWQVFRISTPE